MRLYLTINGKTTAATQAFDPSNREQEIRKLEKNIDFRQVIETKDDGKHVTYVGKSQEEYAAIHPM